MFEDRNSLITTPGAVLDFDANDLIVETTERRIIFANPDGKAIVIDNLTNITPTAFGAADSLTLEKRNLCNGKTSINGGSVINHNGSGGNTDIISNVNSVFNNTMTTLNENLDQESFESTEAFNFNQTCIISVTDIQNFVNGNTSSITNRIHDSAQEAELWKPINLKNNTVFNCKIKGLVDKKIQVSQHCYGCTAGAGSSCQGTIA